MRAAGSGERWGPGNRGWGTGNWTQGAIEFDQWSQYTTNNPFADMLIGHTDGESQVANAPNYDMAYHEWALYAQDSWHATTKLTLNYGVRFDHDGQWYPLSGRAGFGDGHLQRGRRKRKRADHGQAILYEGLARGGGGAEVQLPGCFGLQETEGMPQAGIPFLCGGDKAIARMQLN